MHPSYVAAARPLVPNYVCLLHSVKASEPSHQVRNSALCRPEVSLHLGVTTVATVMADYGQSATVAGRLHRPQRVSGLRDCRVYLKPTAAAKLKLSQNPKFVSDLRLRDFRSKKQRFVRVTIYARGTARPTLSFHRNSERPLHIRYLDRFAKGTSRRGFSWFLSCRYDFVTCDVYPRLGYTRAPGRHHG